MKTIKVALLALSLSTMTMMSFTSIPAASSVNKGTENHISWVSETIDVGNIPKGVPHTIKFEFKNNTDKAVVITNVKAQCGCTATEYTKESVAPGQKGYVNAIFNAASAGAFSKTVTITTSDSETPKKLTFSGTVTDNK